MSDLTKYLDKQPTRSYTLGPSGKGFAQTGFYDLWRAWYDEGVGITYVKDSLYNNETPTGYHASGSQDILFAQTMSATFDSGAYLWAAVGNFGSFNLFQFSGNSYINKGLFSGHYPVMFYNVANTTPQSRYVHCFYLKSGENKIYSRSNTDNFAGEILVHQDFQHPVKSLNNAGRFESHNNKLSILGLYQNGDGFQLVSDCFYTDQTGIYVNFSGYADGDITNLNEWICSPAINFTDVIPTHYEAFAAYPTGSATIDYQFNSGVLMSGGFIWP